MTCYAPEGVNHVLREIDGDNSVMKVKKQYLRLSARPIHPGTRQAMVEWLSQFSGRGHGPISGHSCEDDGGSLFQEFHRAVAGDVYERQYGYDDDCDQACGTRRDVFPRIIDGARLLREPRTSCL